MKDTFFYFCIFLNKIFPLSGMPVLLYHQVNDSGSRLSVSPDRFEEQMKYLHDAGYRAVTPENLEDFLLHKKPLPKKSIMITFDDGFLDNHKNALPILKKYNFNAVFFITTKFIGKKAEYCSEEKDQEMKMMNVDEIRNLYNSGHIIANHLHSHRNFDQLNENEISEEYEKSREILSSITGSLNNLDYIAYPRNKKNEKTENNFKKIGVLLAFGGNPGIVRKGENQMDMPRIEVFKNDSLLKFKAKLTPFYYFVKKYLR